jgi:hypothetical protein
MITFSFAEKPKKPRPADNFLSFSRVASISFGGESGQVRFMPLQPL